MTCPFLEYRAESNGQRFDTDRAYCTAAKRFVQPMRSDICNDRYDLAHDRHCEIYLEHAADAEAAGPNAANGTGERPSEDEGNGDGGDR